MIKAKSKSKLKSTSGMLKKPIQNKQLKSNKKPDNKENGISSLRLTQVLGPSKIVNRESESSQRAKNKTSAQLCLPKKPNVLKKVEDEQFIQKLFSQTQKIQQKPSGFIENLIEEIVPTNSNKNQEVEKNYFLQILNLQAELQKSKRNSKMLSQEIEELKFYVSNFTFKVFDLTVICRKYLENLISQKQRSTLCLKINQVVSYIQSLVRQWSLEEKIRTHTQSTFRKALRPTTSSQLAHPKMGQLRKRCHTQSMKIPVEEYLESLENKDQQIANKNQHLLLKQQLGTFGSKISYSQYENKYFQGSSITSIDKGKTNLHLQLNNLQKTCTIKFNQDDNQQIMKIVSRRNSEPRKQDDEVYVILKNYQPLNTGHQLTLRAGQRVTVIDKSNPDRWVGFKDGVVGYFPRSLLF